MLEGLTSNPHEHEADETAEKQRARKEQELHSLDKEERAIVPVQAALLTADLTGIGKTHWIANVDAAIGIILSVRKKDDRSKRWKGV